MFNYHVMGSDFSDPYKNHQIVKSIFEGSEKVLFLATDNKLIVRANVLPNNTKLCVMSASIGSSDAEIALGQVYQFRIKMSLYVRKGSKKFKFVGNVQEYIDDRLKDRGFEIITSQYTKGSMISVRKGVKFHANYVDVTGYLKVVDVEKFVETLNSGIGRDKMLGLGLLVVV